MPGPRGGGTTTNTEGKFTVNASQGQQLAVSYIGYREATVEVTSKTFYEIALQSDSEQIDDVVVVGYGTQKKVNVTGSVSTIDASTFEKRPVVSASVALQGMAPGVTVTTPSAPRVPTVVPSASAVSIRSAAARPPRWCSSTGSRAVWTASIPYSSNPSPSSKTQRRRRSTVRARPTASFW